MSYYDIAQQFSERAAAIAYPDFPQMPERRDDESPSAFGRRVAQFHRERDKARKGREDYRKLHAECDADFKTALAKELGLSDHPKFDALYRIAWQEGHSSGYTEVANYADTLAELLRD